jgi:FKBP-type peptidyl-prolyl cis-trans isomerase
MRKFKEILKITTLVLVALFIVSACKKQAVDPDAALKASLQKYAITTTTNNEADLITAWLDQMQKNQEDVKTTSTGIHYIQEKEGTGATVVAGDTVTVKYIGFFLNGDIFDESAKHGGSLTYVHKKVTMIKGWEEGIEVLNKGASAIFLIPSNKGYGLAGNGPVAPNVPLLFSIEVVDIKKGI